MDMPLQTDTKLLSRESYTKWTVSKRLCVGLERVQQGAPTQLVISARVGAIVSATAFCTAPLADDQVSILLCPSHIQAHTHAIVVVQQLPCWPQVASSVVAYDGKVDQAILVWRIWHIVAQVVFGIVLGAASMSVNMSIP